MTKLVKIKTWEAMVEEFGINENCIKCKHGFVDTMEIDMPKDRIIEVEVEYDNLLNEEYLTWYPSGYTWDISEDMIEKYIGD